MKVAESVLTLCDPKDCSLSGSSVHRILQARILEWVACPFSSGSSQPRNRTRVSSNTGRFFTSWVTREASNRRECGLKTHFVGKLLSSQVAIFWSERKIPEFPRRSFCVSLARIRSHGHLELKEQEEKSHDWLRLFMTHPLGIDTWSLEQNGGPVSEEEGNRWWAFS